MWDKSKNQFCYRLSNKRRPKVRFFGNFKKKTSNTKSVLFVFSSNFSNLNDFCLDLCFMVEMNVSLAKKSGGAQLLITKTSISCLTSSGFPIGTGMTAAESRMFCVCDLAYSGSCAICGSCQ